LRDKRPLFTIKIEIFKLGIVNTFETPEIRPISFRDSEHLL
jgi:hypothetical protein